MPKAQW
jgi:hypothetical protein